MKYWSYFFLLFSFTLLTIPSLAQKSGYQIGYVITLNSDTIEGYIKDRDNGTFERLYQKVRFKPLNKGRRKKYDAKDIHGYGYDGSHFHSINFREDADFFRLRYYSGSSDSKTFLKVIENSPKLVYYEKEFVYDDNSFLDSFPLFYNPVSNKMVRVTQGILGLKKKHLIEFFGDCTKLTDAIAKDHFSKRDIMEIYNFYLEKCE